MTSAKDLSRLSELGQLMLDHRLGHLRSTARQLEQSRMRLQALNRAADPSDLEPVFAAKVALGYERWADLRRAELNLVIARQTAAWLEARDDAKTAFGRVRALEGVANRAKQRRSADWGLPDGLEPDR
jgi:hypothetical protein